MKELGCSVPLAAQLSFQLKLESTGFLFQTFNPLVAVGRPQLRGWVTGSPFYGSCRWQTLRPIIMYLNREVE